MNHNQQSRAPQHRSAVVREETVRDYGNQARQDHDSRIEHEASSDAASHPHDADTLETVAYQEGDPVKLKEQPIEQRRMERRLRREMFQEGEEQTKRFVPKGALRRICNYEAVLEVLLAHERFKYDENEAIACADYVCGPKHQRQLDATSSARQIFGILVCLAHVWMIDDFRKANIFDDDLPLRGTQNQRKLWSRKSNAEAYLPFLAGDDHRLIAQDFFDRQWQFHVPDIIRIQPHDKSDTTKGPFAQNYEIDAEAVMPWTEKKQMGEGAYGTVFRIRIHKDHHNLVSTSLTRMDINDGRRHVLTLTQGLDPGGKQKHFALKIIKPGPSPESSSQALRIRKLFERELDAFRRNLDSPHVVYLCATFRRGKENMFIMPWASKGNLADLLTSEQHPPTLSSSSRVDRVKFMKWIYKQCAGLVGGLACIHDRLKNAPTDDLALEDERFYGVHSDIKPENILHFVDEEDPRGFGILKLADFGRLKYHTYDTKTQSIRDVTMGPAHHIYAAPELVYSHTISRSIDVWAFGCVFSELLTWAVKGADSIRNFRDRRLQELRIDPLGRARSWKDDRFFICHPTIPLSPASTAPTVPGRKKWGGGAPYGDPELKQSVSEVSRSCWSC